MQLLKIKPYRQSACFCGPSSLKMVLEYYGVNKTEKELGVLAKCSAEKGTTAKNLATAAIKLGFKSKIKDYSTLNDLRKLLRRGVPVIVDWFSLNDGHYSVVTGMDHRYIYLQDPELGKINKLDLATFERVWFDFEPAKLKTKNDIIIRRMIVIEK